MENVYEPLQESIHKLSEVFMSNIFSSLNIYEITNIIV